MSLWLAPALLAIVATGGMLAFVLRRPPPPPLWPSLPVVLVGSFLFACGDLYATHLAKTPQQVWLGCLVLYAGVSVLGPGIWTVSLRFAAANQVPFSFGRAWWTRLPWVLAGVGYLVILTNPLHGHFLTPVVGARNEYGILWYVIALGNYVGAAAAVVLFAATARRTTSQRVRRHGYVMIAAGVAPLLANFVYITAPVSLPVDTTLIGFSASALLMLLGIYWGQLFSLTPVAFWDALRQDSDAILVLDASRHLLYANPAAEQVFAGEILVAGESILPTLARRMRDSAGDASVDEHDLLRAGYDPIHGSMPPVVRYLTDPPRWLSLETTMLVGRSGRAAGYYLRIRDETALHDAGNAIAEQAAALGAVLAATDDAFLVTHIDGRVLFSNERYRDLFGEPRPGADRDRDSLRETAGAFIREPDESVAWIERVLREPERSLSGSVALLDGRHVEWHYFPLSTEGRITGRVWQLRDVTQQRAADEHMRETQKAESLGVIAGGVAHDFNNLLAVIQGNATLARRATPSEDERLDRYLTDIESASERAGDLTEQLLAYAGRGARQIREHDLSEVVADVRSLLQVSISKQVSLECALSNDLPRVHADISQLRQVVMNLVLNAAEAVSGKGTISLQTDTVSLSEREIDGMQLGRPSPGTFVRLRVGDDGCGMDGATLSRIFEPFFTTKFAGRGLGLAATMGVLRGHGAALRVDTLPGRGSVFSVYFPAATTGVDAITPS